MRYCGHCGKQVDDEAFVCTNCGCTLPGANGSGRTGGNTNDTVNLGFVVLSILFWPAGIILWPVKYKEEPNAASVYGVAGITAMFLTAIVSAAQSVWFVFLIQAFPQLSSMRPGDISRLVLSNLCFIANMCKNYIFSLTKYDMSIIIK